MAINAYGDNLTTNGAVSTSPTNIAENKTFLGKDDFMTLLLVELQNQDPTEPMDTEKILTQTSQLATLEASDKTNTALENLAASMSNTQQFSMISAIGKMADLGSDAIMNEEGSASTFEIYFPSDIQQGSVDITDSNGNIVKTLDVGTNPSGVYQFTWDGIDSSGNSAQSGIYHVNSTYTNAAGDSLQTRLGAYPIESVRFDEGNTLVKVGSSYVAIENIKEVY